MRWRVILTAVAVVAGDLLAHTAGPAEAAFPGSTAESPTPSIWVYHASGRHHQEAAHQQPGE